jgi:hypothetical protein
MIPEPIKSMLTQSLSITCTLETGLIYCKSTAASRTL